MSPIEASHRPWPPPPSPWVMAQRWHDLLFAHWPLPPETLRPVIPPGLELDTVDGQAWLGIVPFRMSGVRLRGLLPFPLVSAFPELNVRTYVTEGTRPGVWFLSLDAASASAVAVARAWFRLPYFHARMRTRLEGDAVVYASRRTATRRGSPPAEFAATYRPVAQPLLSQRGTLAYWLTERYSLYTAGLGGRLYRGEILHNPWPLQAAAADIRTNTMARSHGIELPDVEPLLHFARRLDVVVWPLRSVSR